MKILRRIMAFPLCLVGVLLPWRLRVIFSECVGWIIQFIYMNYIYTLRFILKELEKAKNSGKKQ
ncbi:MAG: hypothetical protein A2X34_00650 [Elusimicrobia bacterium GWC2_51_8]|nr:MAG: hypothetical protein A2X33_06415 [Elusimicrobia bacterium GWA2_51_34]OGR64127.1 MAG: hypothetical protein A2X34_00650 [Elusimicrobia bacterium GWC2_51_8]OGR86752.1 MAG: hypothetical protein A2021_09710 [Elusimicrobia bacterium GWF2_52_66]HAF95075.1 hypothetical protein [Elusimicrobiota bacterium]HCE99028.1 hypothetical protein [Elusimicrobiota bacterium]